LVDATSVLHALIAIHSLGEVHAGEGLIRDMSKNVLSAFGAINEHGELLSLYIRYRRTQGRVFIFFIDAACSVRNENYL
jgi:hypothetical protein